MSYFELFDLPVACDVKLNVLETQYFKAQREYHPDRFIGKPAEQRNAALQRSMDINQAYETLKDPLKRAQHILSLQGIIVGTDKDSVKPAQELLMEIMELRENEPAKEILENLVANSQMVVAGFYEQSKFAEMAQEIIRLGYLRKILSEKRK